MNEELSCDYSSPSLLPGRELLKRGQVTATLSSILQPLCSAHWELTICTFSRAVKWTVKGNRLKGSLNCKTAPVFLGEGSVCLSLLSAARVLPKRPFRHLIMWEGKLCCHAATPAALARRGVRGGGLGVSPGGQRCHPSLSAIPHSPSPSHRGERRLSTPADFLCEDDWVHISLVHLSGWNPVSWLIFKWNRTPFTYVNLLLARDGTLSCSNLPVVSAPTFSLPLFSLALKYHCVVVVKNDAWVWQQKLVAKAARRYSARLVLRPQ